MFEINEESELVNRKNNYNPNPSTYYTLGQQQG